MVVTKPAIQTVVLNSGNVSAAYTQTLSATGTSPITWSIEPLDVGETGLPPGLSLIGAAITGTPTTQGTYVFSVKASNITGDAYADIKQFSITVGPSGAPIITTGAILSAVQGTLHTTTFAANGTAPISWAVTDGTIPPGLSLVDNVLSGTPSAGGVFNFQLTATNAIDSDSRAFICTVAVPPAITTTTLPNGLSNTEYNQAVTVTGDLPITWSVLSPVGSETGLPPGLAISASTGVISGTTAQAGTYTFRVRAVNSVGIATETVTLVIVSSGGMWLNGKEVDSLFVNGIEIDKAYVAGQRIF